MKGIRILWLLLTSPGVKRNWQYFCYVPAIMALEAYARFRGMMDYRLWKRMHTVWEVAETTKVTITPALSDSAGAQQTLS
jgi:hypothetical protein